MTSCDVGARQVSSGEWVICLSARLWMALIAHGTEYNLDISRRRWEGRKGTYHILDFILSALGFCPIRESPTLLKYTQQCYEYSSRCWAAPQPNEILGSAPFR
jgi:hypothetical protein